MNNKNKLKLTISIATLFLAGCTESKLVGGSAEAGAGSEDTASANPVSPTTPVDPSPEPIEPLVAGERANWIRGTWGINWKPVELYGGKGETLSIDGFIEQISEFKTVDFLQIHLNDSYIMSPVHISPHDILESLWQGDTGDDGKPVNLVVPRAAAGTDPFMDMLKATKAAGLKTMIYLNSSNMLERVDEVNPEVIPNITERWKAFCDTDSAAQTYLSTESYHYMDGFPDRPYMFCYAEFVLKEYATRYGDLVDGWLFDSGKFMTLNGDNEISGEPEEQLIYKAFTDAVRVGNPLVAVSFNNGPERVTEELNPFSEAVLYDDFMFGHPYNGGRIIGDHELGLYDRNYAHIQKITETGGNIHVGGLWDWDDKVVGHFDPPMSTTSWKGGSTPALTDEEFILWNLEATQGGGSISWGAPLINASGSFTQLNIQDWGMAQLKLMDDHLSVNQAPGAPNWARAETPLTEAVLGQPYSHKLVNSVDFWDPESDAVTLSLVSGDTDLSSWLTITAEPGNTGNWILSGTPTETSGAEYEVLLRAEDATGSSDRVTTLKVGAAKSDYPFKGSVDILATADTNYGIDVVATMTSAVITAPDGLATFQVAFDVTPPQGDEIVSGDTTNATIPQSWGVGSDAIFRGDDGESIQSIDNVRVVNFSANGSNLTASDITDFSFEYATVADAQSTGDRILIDVNGITNAEGGDNVVTNPDVISLRIVGYVPVVSFKFGVGTDDSTNKWAVSGINVSYVISSP